MGLSTAEKNRRKRERKKREKEERRHQEEEALKREDEKKGDDEEVEIEYVAESLPEIIQAPKKAPPEEPVTNPSIPEGLPPAMGGPVAAAQENHPPEEDMGEILRRFHERAAVSAVVTDDERKADGAYGKSSDGGSDEEREGDDDDDDERREKAISKNKLRALIRPSVADLKRRVKRPDLVEAHDVTSADPDFLIHLKAIPGTVPVPIHWGRKRKYLQGKRGFEKPPFKVREKNVFVRLFCFGH